MKFSVVPSLDEEAYLAVLKGSNDIIFQSPSSFVLSPGDYHIDLSFYHIAARSFDVDIFYYLDDVIFVSQMFYKASSQTNTQKNFSIIISVPSQSTLTIGADLGMSIMYPTISIIKLPFMN